jgi:TRAP-type C4-dicarboxylate transport system permease small subunit
MLNVFRTSVKRSNLKDAIRLAGLSILGFLFYMIGGGLNILVRTLNDGMPVLDLENSIPVIKWGRVYVQMNPSTRLAFLGDIIPIPPHYYGSIGDLLLFAGVFFCLVNLVVVVVIGIIRKREK